MLRMQSMIAVAVDLGIIQEAGAADRLVGLVRLLEVTRDAALEEAAMYCFNEAEKQNSALLTVGRKSALAETYQAKRDMADRLKDGIRGMKTTRNVKRDDDSVEARFHKSEAEKATAAAISKVISGKTAVAESEGGHCD